MNIWCWADSHFGHDNIRVHCNRPFTSCKEMDETMIANHNAVVGHKDLVYILGDFAWKRHLHYLGALNGRHILIRGNHDKMGQDVLTHFTEVHDILGRMINGHYVVMCHWPMRSWNRSFHGAWHLYGHVHGRIPDLPESLSLDVGVDVWGYTPVNWDVLEARLIEKHQAWLDYWRMQRAGIADHRPFEHDSPLVPQLPENEAE